MVGGGPMCFAELHGLQAGTTLSAVCVPPRASGMTCSCWGAGDLRSAVSATASIRGLDRNPLGRCEGGGRAHFPRTTAVSLGGSLVRVRGPIGAHVRRPVARVRGEIGAIVLAHSIEVGSAGRALVRGPFAQVRGPIGTVVRDLFAPMRGGIGAVVLALCFADARRGPMRAQGVPMRRVVRAVVVAPRGALPTTFNVVVQHAQLL